MEWISLEDRLPKTRDLILIYMRKLCIKKTECIFLGRFLNNKFFQENFEEWERPEYISHWMPLPEPPN